MLRRFIAFVAVAFVRIGAADEDTAIRVRSDPELGRELEVAVAPSSPEIRCPDQRPQRRPRAPIGISDLVEVIQTLPSNTTLEPLWFNALGA